MSKKLNKKYIALFPGQGSQSLGMLGDLSSGEYSAVIAEVFNQASEIVGEDLWDIAQNNVDKLNQTNYTQPIMLCADVAIWKIWLQNCASLPEACAGHSLGEYAALVASGLLEFESAVRLVHKRAILMQQAVAGKEVMMAAIIGLDSAGVAEVCDKVNANSSGMVSVANFNSQMQTVIAGEKASVSEAMLLAKESGAKLAKALPVSVPSHCSLLKEAAQKFANELNADIINIDNSQFAVYFNVDASVKTAVEDIKQAMSRQIDSPVHWVQTIEKMLQDHPGCDFFEFGPGKVLTGLSKRIIPADCGSGFCALNTDEALQQVLVS